MISDSCGFTTDEVAAALGCCRNNTSRKIRRLEGHLTVMLRSFDGRRADNLAEQVVAILETGGRLAMADRGRMKQFVMRLAADEITNGSA